MKICELERKYQSERCTMGKLRVIQNAELVFECFVLEPEGPDEKRKNKNRRIPAGEYDLGWHDSPSFGYVAPHIYGGDVAKNRYILIHKGNTRADTRGCLIVGEFGNYSSESVTNSNVCFNKLCEVLYSLNIKQLRIKNKFK